MSSTTGTRSAPLPPGGQAQPGAPAGQEQGAALGLISATALVMGSIIDAGARVGIRRGCGAFLLGSVES